MENFKNRDPAEDYPILEYLRDFSHLKEPQRKIAESYGHLAFGIALSLPKNAETSTALRKLLESKDCAVRSSLELERGE